MTETTIIQGDAVDLPYQAVNRGGVSNPAYASGDTLAAFVYQGNNLASLFSPAVTWYTGYPSGGQTGYDQGQVLVSLTNAQTATLEANGDYTLLVEWTPAVNPSKTATIVRALLVVKPAPGTSVNTILPYCQLSDMLMHADWITIVQNPDVDGEGFINQRLRAREWLDQIILNTYRGAFVGMFEEHSVAAFAFGNVGWRRSLGPSQTLKGYLAANDLILNPDIVQACAYKAISIVGLRQIGINNQFAAFGAYFRDMATRDLQAITAEIDTNGDGIGELFINMNATNTLRT